MLTIELLNNLHYGTTLYHQSQRNADGSPVRCRINGKLKTWKRDPNRFEIPVKYGLKDCFYITNESAIDWCINEEDAMLYPVDSVNNYMLYKERNKHNPSHLLCNKCHQTFLNLYRKGGVCMSYCENNMFVCPNCQRNTVIKNANIKERLICYIRKATDIEIETLYQERKKNHPNAIRVQFYKITTWDGTLLARSFVFSTHKHNMCNTCLHVWFKLPDNNRIWHGVHLGDNEICRCKLTKQTTF